jgi:hypothetical protein
MKILFVAGFGPIVDDGKASQKLYMESLDLHLTDDKEAGYFYTENLEGVKHFALWPLSMVAQACFDKDSWPGGIAVPQAWIDFEVEDLETATAELESRGYRLLVAGRKEPWGQTVTRLISPEGLLVAITVTPWLR